ncbi:MAG TPA: hypothetical protein VL651_16070 [Bacteroidia bacterium]|jgi:hypothetical protein|nr:hypothetical protein [Bacteroidia bacterium]
MKLCQNNNWSEEDNRNVVSSEESHVVANTLPSGYTDISSIENWAKFGPALIGSAPGFKDWKCLQREIKSLALDIVDDDFDANWNALNSNEKLIVCTYILSTVPPSKLVATIPDAEERTALAINFDLNNRRARGNWQSGTGRIEIMRIYLFSKIGKTNALLTFKDAVDNSIFELYEGGIEGSVEDGIEGINDFILARSGTGYSSTGLAQRGYPVVDGSSDTLEDVAETLVNIASNGIY